MSDIKSKPDENGVPMCQDCCDYLTDSGQMDASGQYIYFCDHPLSLHEPFAGKCYPKMVRIVAAAKLVAKVRGDGESAITQLAARTNLREALK